ncbi:MAG TPA: 16S rRNA (guanine(527)-N(7))-methyltransferase RsmG [Steroidobacteraceae bacterium]|jgi:16S rRNA (guanine527-N7)-methyltransferase
MINCPPWRARSVALNPTDRLRRDAAVLGVALTEPDVRRLLLLLDELALWNKRFNLTAITAPEAMLTHHLLDSLSIHPDLHGQEIADVGTGAGFPGLPLALANPQRRFTLIDSSAKKIRFVANTAARMGLTNVTAVHARSEAFRPAAPLSSVVARGFAPLPRLVELVAPLCAPGTRVLAMKGRRPDEEILRLQPPWKLLGERGLSVPGLDAARCLLVLGR